MRGAVHASSQITLRHERRDARTSSGRARTGPDGPERGWPRDVVDERRPRRGASNEGEKDAMGTLVNYATEKGVALLTLTDPPVNAYTHEMFKELDACILEARFDDDIHVIVVTGHGDKYFSAGANANMLKEADESFKYYFFLHASETLVRLENTPKLVIAAINGHCFGGGLEVALACDIRIARAGALQIASPEVELGLMPGAGGTRRLV